VTRTPSLDKRGLNEYPLYIFKHFSEPFPLHGTSPSHHFGEDNMVSIVAEPRIMKKIAAGTWIDNPVVGQRSLLVKLPAETGGRYFEMEYVCRPFAGRNAIPPHYHPTYTERFEILSGHARYRFGKLEQIAGPGEQLLFSPGVEHIHPWSHSNEELHVRMICEADPPDLAGLNANLNTGITLYGLARDVKVNKEGLPSFLQQAVSGRSTLPGACPAGLSIRNARLLLGFFGALGALFGYRVSYPQYGEV
jgi:quercetin dioxygenase-like cupin family protein